MVMKMSAKGRAILEGREGVRLKAYLDTATPPVWTIGVGHTSAAGEPKVTRGLTITAAECDAIFARDLAKYEKTVNDSVKVPVTQVEFDALASFCFNIGQGGFASSTTVRLLNAEDRAGAAAAMLKWRKPASIIGRRTGEMKQFLSGAP